MTYRPTFVKIGRHFINVESIIEISTAWFIDKDEYIVLVDAGITDYGDEDDFEIPHCLIAFTSKEEADATRVALALARTIGTVIVFDPEETMLPKEESQGEVATSPERRTWPEVGEEVEFQDREGRVSPGQKGTIYKGSVLSVQKQHNDPEQVCAEFRIDEGTKTGWVAWIRAEDLRVLVKGPGEKK